MSENPGGTPPRDDEPAPDAVAPEPTAPDPAAQPAAPEPPAPPVAPPAPAYGAPSEPPAGYTPPAPSYGQPAAGGYPPPAQGGYPPPAQGGYPPPPPAGGYGQAPGGYPASPPPPGGYSAVPPSPIGAAISYGWNAFTRGGGIFVAATLVWLIITTVVFTIVVLAFGGIANAVGTNNNGRVGFGLSFTFILIIGIFSLVFYLVEAAFVRASLKVTYGQRLEFGDFFKFDNATNVLITALLIAGINLVLGLVTWIPLIGQIIGLAANLALLFTLWFVVDKNLSPIDAIKASVELVRANLATTILFYLLAAVILFVGFLLCGLGALVAIPVVLVATSYLYRNLLGEPIAPVA
ncbi:hypothetical protein [Cellulomonas sp. PhB150]|uniref:hypothetical protein n=1 Tax=Cellulomonas sp. PhB150 TaxID=2485188 RepID=UPI000FA24EA7|nr:hypothetical protein [Cellulomonas sp. PhB150]ROS31045.1 putative membrane protein [Cellulomonas sp. PhB150]